MRVSRLDAKNISKSAKRGSWFKAMDKEGVVFNLLLLLLFYGILLTWTLIVTVVFNSTFISVLAISGILVITFTLFKDNINLDIWQQGKAYRELCNILNRLPKEVKLERERQRELYNSKADMVGSKLYIDENYELKIPSEEAISKMSIPSCVNFIKFNYSSTYRETMEYLDILAGDTPLLIDFEGCYCGHDFNNIKEIKLQRDIMIACNLASDTRLFKIINKECIRNNVQLYQ